MGEAELGTTIEPNGCEFQICTFRLPCEGIVIAPGYLPSREENVGLARDEAGNGTSTSREVGVGEAESSQVMCDSMFGIEMTGMSKVEIEKCDGGRFVRERTYGYSLALYPYAQDRIPHADTRVPRGLVLQCTLPMPLTHPSACGGV